ncbi:MAG: LPS translocon maturation chaperone LptM [Sulfuricaulis sp.]
MSSGKNHSLRCERRRRVLLSIVAFPALLSAACGKRGPLYLPDGAGAQEKAGEPAAKTTPSQPDKSSGEDVRQK